MMWTTVTVTHLGESHEVEASDPKTALATALELVPPEARYHIRNQAGTHGDWYWRLLPVHEYSWGEWVVRLEVKGGLEP